MAHGREGPDIVMQIRYAGASEVRAVTDHELHRSPDGWSAIDPERTHLNVVLHGPVSQQAALEQMWAQGVKKPAQQAEEPYVQIVLSASPAYFRDEGQGPGQWNSDRLELWRDVTMDWLRSEYGADLAHVSLHLDEETPHFHVLIIPTYEKKARKPGRQKRGESDQDFAARIAEAESRATIRTAGRSSNPYWSQLWCRRDARRSYHAAVDREGLDLGYGKDFVGEGQPSPDTKPTGTWVRQEAGRLAADRAQIEADRAALTTAQEALTEDRAHVQAERAAVVTLKEALAADRAQVEVARASLTAEKGALIEDRVRIEADRAALINAEEALSVDRRQTETVRAALTSEKGDLIQDRAQIETDRAVLMTAQEALTRDRVQVEVARAALTSEQGVLFQDRAQIDAVRSALITAEKKLMEDRAQVDALHKENIDKANGWARKIRANRQQLDEERKVLNSEKAHVQELAKRLFGLVKHVEKALKVVLDFAPRIRRVLKDAEASQADRVAAADARRDIIDIVPPLRRDRSQIENVLAMLRARSAFEEPPEVVEEPSGSGIDGP